jgi:membrane protein implicated in regulation of membrane protease activity
VRVIAVSFFLAGLLLAVRVMFFGVRKQLSDEQLDHRKWPLALASFLAVVGAMLYARAATVTAGWVATVLIAGLAAAIGAWMLVKKSAAIPSTDPEDDPRYRFQGHVARIVEPIGGTTTSNGTGRIAFDFDGKRHELGARWSPEADLGTDSVVAAVPGAEVVIEYVDGNVAYVEPWAVVEKRL